MNRSSQLLLVLTTLILCAGCMNMRLAVREHRPQLAEPLGVEQDDIQILNYCGVKVAYERTQRVSKPISLHS
ncbi:MAG: hypothetical protein O3C43_23940 [Verrucomicrobia bacterium]|nr:hypothetical protein [Verrucomicrobiota bacterium]